jgi:putative peptidoglycan lipid II flippase
MSNDTNLTRERINTAQPGTQAGSVIKNALKMAFGTMTSRMLGLFREVLLAALFEKHITDAWSAAFRIPNLFRRLLGEGSLSVSFIPVFVEAHLDSEARAKNLVNTMYSILLIILSVITVFGLLFPDLILSTVLDPTYIAQTEKYNLTVHMAKIMFLFLFFISSFAFFMGILNALGEFFLPAIAPTLWNLAMVISTIWPEKWLSKESANYGDQLAWGVVIGGILQCAILIPALYRKGYFPKLTTQFKNPDVARVFRNMVPGLIGTGLLQFTTVINLRFSSSLNEGTISYINYIDRLIELPLSLISVSLGTALLPSLSKLWSQNSKEAMAEESRKYLELNLLISIAAACGLYALAQPIVQMLFGRGHFSTNDVILAAGILKTYCWILIFASGVRVLTPAYYAVQNTWLPAVISGVCVVIHLFLAPFLMDRYQVHGLMMSTMTTAALNMFALLVLYNKFIYKFNYRQYSKNISKFAVIGAGVYAISQIYYLMEGSLPSNVFGIGFNLLLTLMAAAATFIVLCHFLKVDLIHEILNKIQARLSRAKK